MTDIIQYPDPSLNVPVDPLHIDEFDKLPHVHQTLTEVMEEYNAVGIAANQLGLNIRACLVQDEFLINPTIIETQEDVTYDVEGCLSIEYGKRGYIRPANEHVVIKYQNEDGIEINRSFAGLRARIALHEIRHLDGKLINEGHEND